MKSREVQRGSPLASPLVTPCLPHFNSFKLLAPLIEHSQHSLPLALLPLTMTDPISEIGLKRNHFQFDLDFLQIIRFLASVFNFFHKTENQILLTFQITCVTISIHELHI